MRLNKETYQAICTLAGEHSLQVLSKVDWDAVKEWFEPKAVCCQCGASEVGDRATPVGWINFDEKWYCNDCRDTSDWPACSACNDSFPDTLMTYLTWAMQGEGFYCPDCLPRAIINEGDILVDKASGQEFYQVGFPNAPVFTSTGIGVKQVSLIWFKWGYVKPEDHTPNTVQYVRVPIAQLRKATRYELSIFNKQKKEKENDQ